MTLEELKQEIEQRTGIPAALLKGETTEETLVRAKALLAYKKEFEAGRDKTPREQFAEWLGTQAPALAAPATPDPEAAIAEIEVAAGKYPSVKDGGSVYTADRPAPDAREAAEQFVEWFNDITAFDPLKNGDVWRKC